MSTLAAYNFDEGTGTLAEDAVGTRDITMSATGWTTGLSGTTALLGEGNDITVPSHAGLETAQRTIAFWASSPLDGGAHWIVQFYDGVGDSAVFGIGWIAGNLLYRVKIGGVNTNYSTPIVDQPTFHHFAITFDGAQMVAYRDAVALSTQAAVGVIDAATALILNDNGTQTIEDLRFFDHALTQPEVETAMNTRVTAAGEAVTGDAALTASAVVASTGLVAASGQAQISASAAILATSTVAVVGQASIAATAAVSATGAVANFGQVAIVATATIGASGISSGQGVEFCEPLTVEVFGPELTVDVIAPELTVEVTAC